MNDIFRAIDLTILDRNQILYYAVKYQGEYRDILTAIQNQEDWKECEYDGDYLTILDKDYPSVFLNDPFPPFILFYEGNLNLLKQENILSFYGKSKELSTYDYKKINKVLSNQKDVVTIAGERGLLDKEIHTRSIQMGCSTIAVLSCGLNVNYPKENKEILQRIKKDFLAISEYPNNAKPYAHHFLFSRRLEICLANKVLAFKPEYLIQKPLTIQIAEDMGTPTQMINVYLDVEQTSSAIDTISMKLLH